MLVHFDVDSRLLRELGARLVGQPHIALAELIKNSYDADATIVEIRVRPDSITIADNGHGMTEKEFRDRWMRIGTGKKELERTSRGLNRPLTGSKGVGRLAVQLLADSLKLVSQSDLPEESPVTALVDWTKAVNAGLLNRATADLKTEFDPSASFPGGSGHGTFIELTRLQQQWNETTLRDLAREIWPLQPPFVDSDSVATSFAVTLDAGDSEADEAFNEQMRAVLGLWSAKLTGKLLPSSKQPPNSLQVRMPDPIEEDEGEEIAPDWTAPPPPDTPGEPRTVRLALEFDDGTREIVHYTLDDCTIDKLRFEIRIFNLKNRQPAGIAVSEARSYLRRFGGVHVYDAGFHLPYYGSDTDWLRIEIDHSHRISRSPLLPESLAVESKVASPMNFLPTNSRLFGAVHVDTSHEGRRAAAISAAAAREALAIQVTRDRLATTDGYRSLVKLTRFAVDFYALKEAQRAVARSLAIVQPRELADPAAARPDSTVVQQVESLSRTISDAASVVPPALASKLVDEINRLRDSAQDASSRAETSASLLGPLATAGIAALAREHEAAKQLASLLQLERRIRAFRDEQASAVADELAAWIRRDREVRALFSPMMNERTRNAVGTFAVGEVVRDVVKQVRPFTPRIEVSVDVEKDLRFALGAYVEWTSMLQNVLINAANALLDTATPLVQIRGTEARGRGVLNVDDNGSGVDLATSNRLFLPFERRGVISEERSRLGLGGTGLGLTIVRMIGNSLGVRTSFVEPPVNFSTSFEISWRIS